MKKISILVLTLILIGCSYGNKKVKNRPDFGKEYTIITGYWQKIKEQTVKNEPRIVDTEVGIENNYLKIDETNIVFIDLNQEDDKYKHGTYKMDKNDVIITFSNQKDVEYDYKIMHYYSILNDQIVVVSTIDELTVKSIYIKISKSEFPIEIDEVGAVYE